MTKNPTPNEILALPLGTNDADAKTVGQYLFKVTRKAFFEQDSFSGKRPFGNSSWEFNIIHAMILNDYIDGELDDEGDVKDYSETRFGELMDSVFDLLESADYSTISLPVIPTDWRVVNLVLDYTGHPKLEDYFYGEFTQEEAELQAKEYNAERPDGTWVAVRLPKVT